MYARASRRQDSLAADAFAASGQSALGYPARGTSNVGCIGTGGQSRRLMTSLVGIPGTRITAIWDVRDDSLEPAKRLSDRGAFVTTDCRELHVRSDVDWVLIGSPDHWHMPMTIDACSARNDVSTLGCRTYSIQ